MYIQLNGQILYYEKSGEGTPLILLHGNGETHEIFDVIIPMLARDYTVYAIDTRGHGLSATPKEFHYDDMAADIAAFLAALHLTKPVLYGYSDGGITGLLFAAEHPDALSALIISGANLKPSDLKFRFLHRIRRSYKKNHDPLLGLMLKEPDLTPAQLAAIQTPTLVLAGSRDIVKKSATKRLAGALPHSTLRILPEETHGSYVEHSPKLYPVLSSFLRENGL